MGCVCFEKQALIVGRGKIMPECTKRKACSKKAQVWGRRYGLSEKLRLGVAHSTTNNIVPLKQMEYGFGYIKIRYPYSPYSTYLRRTIPTSGTANYCVERMQEILHHLIHSTKLPPSTVKPSVTTGDQCTEAQAVSCWQP